MSLNAIEILRFNDCYLTFLFVYFENKITKEFLLFYFVFTTSPFGTNFIIQINTIRYIA
jgi:hypothetical protein